MEEIQIGDRVEVWFDSKTWSGEGWLPGTVVKIEPYTEHRNFYWVALDSDATSMFSRGKNLISVLNPKNIRRIE